MAITAEEEYEIMERYIRAHSKKVKRIANGISYCCLYHDDDRPSASHILKNGKILDICSICGKIHQRLKKDSGAWEERPPKQEYSPFEKFLYYNQQQEYKYFDFKTEKYLYSCFRLKDKSKGFPVGVRDGIHTTSGTSGVDTSLAVFTDDIKKLKKAIEDGALIAYTEGEKDCLAVIKNGQICFTCGGAGKFREALLPYLTGGRFIVFADNDDRGIEDAEHITALLNTVGTARMIVPVPDVPKADISDFFAAGHSRENFGRMLQQGQSAVKETVHRAAGNRQTLLDRLVELDAVKRFSTNDKGSAELFTTLFKNVNRYNPTQKDWMHFNGIKWEPDVEGMRARKNAKRMVDALLSYAVQFEGLDEKQRQDYMKYASKMMSYRDRNTMITDAKDLNFFNNEELDREDNLLNCQNCVLDLSVNPPKQLKHDADLLLSKCCNANYDPAAKCELWEKTVSEIMEGDEEKIKYLQKIFGLSLTGCTAEEELYFFYGGSTRNGKSTICETALSILADYGATISPETLAMKQNKDSRTASPDVAKLAGSRLVIASEPPKRMIFDTSLVKTLTGRDRVTARFMYQNEFTFTPRFKVILNTNYLPTITDGTIFKSGRVRVISFNKHFGKNEQNKRLKDELKEESDGILNWMIEGLYLYRREGMEAPDSIRKTTEEYENDSDKIGRFISECLVKSDKNVSAKAVYEAYSKWCIDSGMGVEGRNNFYIELKTKSIFSASGTVNGKTVKNIVKGYILATDEEFMEADDKEVPFM